jgi:hypothetical protein
MNFVDYEKFRAHVGKRVKSDRGFNIFVEIMRKVLVKLNRFTHFPT